MSEFDLLRAAARASVGLAGTPQGTGTTSNAQVLANILAKAQQVGGPTNYANLLSEIGISPSNNWATNGNASLSSV